MTSVNIGFILSVTILIIWTTGIFKIAMNPGIEQNVAAQFFLLTPYIVTETSSLVAPVLHPDLFWACCYLEVKYWVV